MVSAMPQSAAIATFLRQLDEIFATKENPTPATANLHKGVVRSKGRRRGTTK